MSALLEVQGLRTLFRTDDGEFAAVDGISFSVDAGRTLAIVGESGCGKSVTALSLMGLVPDPPGRIAAGSVRFEGRELVQAAELGRAARLPAGPGLCEGIVAALVVDGIDEQRDHRLGHGDQRRHHGLELVRPRGAGNRTLHRWPRSMHP